MSFLYNEGYMRTYRKYRDVMDTNVTIVLNKTITQTEDPIFQLKALPKTRVFIDEQGNEQTSSSLILFIDELKELYSINGNIPFPIKDIKNRVKIIRFNDYSYLVESKNINFFNNLLKFDLVTRI